MKITKAETQNELIDFPLENKAVICIGYGTSRTMALQFVKDEPDAEIWTMNSDRFGGATRHFQIHRPEKHPDMPKIHWEFADLKIHIYTYDNYPMDQVRREFHHSTVDYMLAIADMEGFSRIYMPGLDFGGERKEIEIHSARYWIGVLEGKGCIVTRSPISRVFDGVRYG